MVHVFIVKPEETAADYYYKLKDRLARIPDLTYYVFTTGVAGDETKLASTVESIFEGEQLRIYSCGSLTTARNVINGIHDLSRIEFAIMPQGIINYLSVWGDCDDFDDVEKMIGGRVVHVDYIKTNHGIALNSISFGIDAYMWRVHDALSELKLFGDKLPWVLASFHSLLTSPNQVCNMEIGDRNIIRKTMSLYMGNVPVIANRFRLSPDNDVTDGIANVIFTYRPEFFTRLFYYIKKLKNSRPVNDNDRYYITEHTNKLKVRLINGAPLLCSMDGALTSAPEWKAEVVKQGLKLVVPGE